MSAIVGACGGCGGLDVRLARHQQNLESLGATTRMIGEAWLAGRISGTYTRTALEQTYQLVEQERAGLATTPQALLDPRGARLSQAAEHLSRLLSRTMHDAAAADADGLRRRLAEIPILPAEGR